MKARSPLSQATLRRLGVQNSSLADYVYIADKAFMSRPSPRLAVRCASTPKIPGRQRMMSSKPSERFAFQVVIALPRAQIFYKPGA